MERGESEERIPLKKIKKDGRDDKIGRGTQVLKRTLE